MLKIGEIQTLRILKSMTFGVYLAEKPTDPKDLQVLLPAAQVPEGAAIGTPVEVFLYRDSEDRLIATTRRPKILMHQTAELEVVQMTRIGAFLDWGLDKDLLLPFHEQRGRLKTGDRVLAALYQDKSGRLCATMNVYPYLEKNAPYQKGDVVTGRVYETSRNFGVFVAVDDRYSALIPKQQSQGEFRPGEIREFRVTGMREDGRLYLSARKEAYLQMGDDAERIHEELIRSEGILPFDDKAAPERIQEAFGISKAAFKRAVGRLMKEGLVEKRDGRLVLTGRKD